jgi:Tol biopolymer transport system component
MTKLKINKLENGLNQLTLNYLILFLFTFFLFGCNSHGQKSPKQSNKRAQSVEGNTAESLPSHIKKLTHFGQRGNWSHDGKKILFLERTYGDVYELTLETGVIRPVTHHFYHEGFVRANYLSNGNILLSGARNFDAENPRASRWTDAELWVLDKSLQEPPVPLGTKCSEGAAVSRKRLHIAWTIDHGDYPDRLPEGAAQIWKADIKYEEGTPKLVNKKLVLDNRNLSFETGLETQDFRPPDEKELIFSAYGHQGTEVMGINLEEEGEVTNYSKNPGYEEPEGIFPSGKYTAVESNRHRVEKVGSQYIDVYKLSLDGSGEMERLVNFNENPDYKSSNPAVSDDGRFMVFQMAKVGDPAGVGRGLFLYDFDEAATKKTEDQQAKLKGSIE